MRTRPARRSSRALLAGVAVAALALAGCGGSGSGDGRTQVEFFQFKGEAVATFDRLIEEFEAEHPDIDIVQNNVPSPDAALRTRLVKRDVPTLMTLNGNGATYGDLASAGIFRDFTGDPALEVTTQSSRDVLNALGSMPGETNGIPFANNANVVIYNVDIFEELELEIPTTWDELLETARTVQDAGYVAFYHTWREAWTTLPPFNALAQNVPEDGFWDRRLAGETTFQAEYPPVMEQLLELREYGPADPFRFDYNTGNRAIANGEAAMYLQGIWAIPSIRGINPDVNLGTFVFPATNDPESNRLVSGVDILLTMPRQETRFDEEAMTFVRWLMEEGPSRQYAAEQNAFSAVDGLEQDDPALERLNEEFENGNTVGFADHFIPSSIPLANMIQGFLIDENLDAFLRDLDRQYDVAQLRRGNQAQG